MLMCHSTSQAAVLHTEILNLGYGKRGNRKPTGVTSTFLAVDKALKTYEIFKPVSFVMQLVCAVM